MTGENIFDSRRLPDGWVVSASNGPELPYKVWKSLPDPDGLQVEIAISKVDDKYQVRTVAESRTSGSDETIEPEVITVEEALNIVYKECNDWDDWIDSFNYAKRQGAPTSI